MHLGALFVVLLAFGLRLYAIDRQDIWGDEAFSIWLSSQSLSHVIAGGSDTHPPLYPSLLFFWLRLAGPSPLSTRFLSAIIGTLTVPLVYGLGRRAGPVLGPSSGNDTLRSAREQPAKRYVPGQVQAGAMLAAFLVAVSPALVYYSQETRMYGLVTLLAAGSVYWTLRLLQQPGSKRLWLAYLATTLAAMYTHYYAFFVVAAENLVLITTWLRRRQMATLGRWLAGQGILIVAYLPWIAVQTSFLSSKASTRFGEWGLATALRIAGDTFSAFGAGAGITGPQAVEPLAAGLVAALYLLAVGAGVVAAIQRRQAESWLVVAYLFLPLVLAWAVNPLMPFFYARYLLLIAPAFYLLAAWGVTAGRDFWRPLGAAGAVILVVGSLWGLQSYYGGDRFIRGRYGQMMSYVENHAQPGDGLILANQLQRPLFEYYQPAELDAYFFPKHEYSLEDPRTARDLESIAERHPRLWLVRFGNPAEYDPDGYLSRWLATHGSKAYFEGWVDADLSLYLTGSAVAGGSSDSLASIQSTVSAELGDGIRLLGYSIGSEQVAAGGPLLLTLYWQATSPIAERYTVFTHLLDIDGKVIAQIDSEPQGGGLPTDRWRVGEVVRDNYALSVSPEASRGPHLLEVGMYLLETMERLPVRDPKTGTFLGDRVVLETIEVVDQ